jgi:hypothetical protein
VTITLHCAHCGSDALVRDGPAPNGKQNYRCHAYGRRSRETPSPNAYPEARREEILHAYQEREPLAWPHAHLWGLSQRLARFVRMTLSFSKSELMHEACLPLFLHRYNLDRAILLK